jgi:flavin-dependent dehydrogenase
MHDPWHDLIVAGAGPAGLATALYAARAGLDTVVIEPRPDPIDKACGEGLMPAAVRALRELGVTVPGQPIRGIRYIRGSHRADAPFRSGTGLGVRRTHLQAALLAQVRAQGIPVLRRSITEVDQDARYVRAAGLAAPYLAAADGLHSPIRRAVGLDPAIGRGARRRWGLRQHFAVQPWSDYVEVHWGADAEVYLTPVGERLLGVAILSSARGSFAEQLARFPAVAERLPAEGATAVRAAGPLRQRVRHRVAGRILLVGDAAGYVDALTGEGIAVALACADALVRSIVEDEPERYELRWRQASRRYRWLTASLLRARQQRWIAPAIVPAAARLPRLFGALVHQIAQ